MKQIHDWCEEHGMKLTGHLVQEDTMLSQLVSNGAGMAHYEYFHIPGMDWLCRPIFHCLTMAQLCSAAAQTGKKQVLSETFALCGHNVGHDELKRNYEWMMVRGVNLMCQHLEGYSLRGIRKRDYPPAMYCQQPWWADYKVFNDANDGDGEEYITRFLDPMAQDFIDNVKEARGEVSQEALEGETFYAAEAMAAGLIDGEASMEEALEILDSLINPKPSININDLQL